MILTLVIALLLSTQAFVHQSFRPLRSHYGRCNPWKVKCSGQTISCSSLRTSLQPPRQSKHLSNVYKQITQVISNINNHISQRCRSFFRQMILAKPSFTSILPLFFLFRKKAWAFVGFSTESIKGSANPVQGMLVWAALFTLSATMHSAESAITKISPWKVQEFAEEEGPKSPFATLNNNLTRLLITILLTTTACSIYSTALFVTSMSALFPKLSLGFITAALTAITLFFGELLPKALAVSNSEMVARNFVPLLSRLSTLLLPFTSFVTLLSDLVLRCAGLRSEEDRSVSEDMLRMVVDEAQRTEGIETGEGRMIKAVLDMQDKEVGKIMQPRVDIVAVPETASATQILHLAVLTKYSRIPVYRGDVDHIVGVIFSKDLLDYMTLPTDMHLNNDINLTRPQMVDTWEKITAKDLVESPFFIPETMTCWNALQEMRKRRIHMAIVVDEYGGTSGLVTFEDILEEVVGEIYDEDDDREEQADDWTIFRNADGTFQMKAVAELDDVTEALMLQMGERDEEMRGEYSTIGGLLCAIAGKIPQEGDVIVFAGYRFRIMKVEENRRLVDIFVEKVHSTEDSEDSEENTLEQYVSYEERELYDEDRENVEDFTLSQENFLLSAISVEATSNSIESNANNISSIEQEAKMKYDSKSNKYLIFQDGQWVDPEKI